MLWIISALFSLFAGLWFMASLASAGSAPQEAAGAAQALCIAVIPYVLARAADGWARRDKPGAPD